MATEITYDSSHAVPSGRLWFGSAGAAIAWALQGFTCFLISTQACADGTGSWGPLSAGGVRVLIGCVTGGYLAIAAASTFLSYTNWRTLANSRRLIESEAIARDEYMALTGVFVGTACILGLLWAGIPPFFLDACNTAR